MGILRKFRIKTYISNTFSELKKKKKRQYFGLPWWSSGYDSKLPEQTAWVQSLVGEVSHAHSVAKEKKKKK